MSHIWHTRVTFSPKTAARPEVDLERVASQVAEARLRKYQPNVIITRERVTLTGLASRPGAVMAIVRFTLPGKGYQ